MMGRLKPKKQRQSASPVSSSSLKVKDGFQPATTTGKAHVRKRFRVAAIAIPLVLFMILELVLRLTGYGYPTGFFLKSRAQGQNVLIENQKVTWRYFPPALARTPQPTLISATKPIDTCRIFILGESAAMGDPDPAFGFGRILEVLLNARHTGKHFEVVNVAITAINSHVVREIAKDCARQQGDLWIVYMGNNEVVGPFGAGTVFGAQVPNLAFIRASIAMKSSRVVQLLDGLRQKFQHSGPAEWEGMEMFLKQQVRQEDRRMQVVYRHFEHNLEDILGSAAKCGARVLLSTVASNLKDCSPFTSLHRPDLNEAQRVQWDKLYQAGIAAEKTTNYSEALVAYEQARELDSGFAELYYRMARCQWALSKYGEARQNFEKARDLDTLRFRADTRINEVIRRVGQTRKKEQLALVDAVDVLAKASPNGIAGEEFLLEHVHFNFHGNYLMARAFVEKLEEAGWADLVPAWEKAAALLAEDECARRLAFTEWDRSQVLEEMSKRLAEAPFTQQLDHEARYARLEQTRLALQASLSKGVLRASEETYQAALSRSPNDWVLRENFAKLLEAAGDPKGAEEQWRKVIQLIPNNEQAYYSLGNVLDGQGKTAEAMQYLREAVQRRPNSLEAHNGLGVALANQGKPAEAMREYETALRRRPEFAEARVNLGQILAQQGSVDEAMAQYEKVLQSNSNNVAAHINLGKLLAQKKQWTEAIEHYESALRLAPENAVAHYNLGNAFANFGQASKALKEFTEAVRCNPNFAEARYNLGLDLAKSGRNAEAREQFAEAVRLKPGFAEGHVNLGVALAKEGQFDQAIEHFQEALRLEPGHAAARKFLDQAVAAKARKAKDTP